MTVTNKAALHDRLYLRLSGTDVSMNVYYDDFSIEPIPKSCNSLVVNGDFEDGNSNFWRPTWRPGIDYDIFDQGADGSQYSLIVEQYTGHTVRQYLDTRCLIEGQEFLISAKHRLLNATDHNVGVECEPSRQSIWDSQHCPTTFVRGRGCDGTDSLELYFWNEIDQFQWNPDDFNNYESVLTIGPELASCDVSSISISVFNPQVYQAESNLIIFNNM